MCTDHHCNETKKCVLIIIVMRQKINYMTDSKGSPSLMYIKY